MLKRLLIHSISYDSIYLKIIRFNLDISIFCEGMFDQNHKHRRTSKLLIRRFVSGFGKRSLENFQCMQYSLSTAAVLSL